MRIAIVNVDDEQTCEGWAVGNELEDDAGRVGEGSVGGIALGEEDEGGRSRGRRRRSGANRDGGDDDDEEADIVKHVNEEMKKLDDRKGRLLREALLMMIKSPPRYRQILKEYQQLLSDVQEKEELEKFIFLRLLDILPCVYLKRLPGTASPYLDTLH